MTLTTIKDVAREAGVSVATVSLFLNGKPGVSRSAQESIAAAVERLGYSPRRVRKTVQSNLICLLMENFPTPVFSDSLYLQVIQGFENEARRLGYHTVVTSIDTSGELKVPEAVLSGEFAGVAAMGGGDLTDDFLRSIQETGTPLILVDNYLLEGDVNSIVPDNELGGYFAARHLMAQGYSPIAVIAGPAKYKTLTDRLQGFMRAMLESGHYPEAWQIQPSISKGFPNKGYREMKALLAGKTRPRAVFCISDRAAFGALAALEEAGLRSPDDVALVGFDDSPESQRTVPPLSTVHMPKREMGVEAAQRLVQVINQVPTMENLPLKILLPAHLIHRSSS